MNICLIGEKSETLILWEGIIKIAFPTSIITPYMNTIDFRKKDRGSNLFDFIICLTSSLSHIVSYVIKKSIETKTPLLCVNDNINRLEYNLLIQKGIKGLINPTNDIYTFQNAVKIVREGGFFIETLPEISFKNHLPRI